MKGILKKFIFTSAMVLTMGLAIGTVSEAKGTVSKVRITAPTKKAKYTMIRKDADVISQLKVKVTAKGGASEEVTYKSSNKSVVSVSSTGEITAKKKGKATITVASKQNKKKKDTLKITVNQKVTGVTASIKKPLASYNDTVTLVKGKTYTLNSKVLPSNANNKDVKYQSSKSGMVSVTAKGKIKAKKTGTAKITVSAKDGSKQQAVLTVHVINKIKEKVTSVTATVDKDVLLAGETASITTTIAPSNASFQKVTYKSSNTEVAKVNATTGKVTAVARGEAVVTVMALDGSKKSAEVKITVAELFTQITPTQGEMAAATVSFGADKTKGAEDAKKLILAITKAGDTKTVLVNDRTAVIENRDGKEAYVGQETLVDYIKNATVNEDKVTMTYTTNVAKAVAALELAKLTSAGTYDYALSIGSVTFSGLDITSDGIKLKIDGKDYDADVVGGIIYVKGDVTADAFAKELTEKKYATLVTIRR